MARVKIAVNETMFAGKGCVQSGQGSHFVSFDDLLRL